MSDVSPLPIAVIGAGPIGLAAAAHLLERGLEPLLLESGASVAANLRSFGHVRLFTPWTYLIDPAARRLLEADGAWRAPADETEVPRTDAVVETYLEPLAQLPALASRLRLLHRVTSISRAGHDRMKDGDRGEAPFVIVADTPDGPRRILARAVIDASGTWSTPNPMGAGGVWAHGERENAAHIQYGMPDIVGRARERYAGKRLLIVGSGHSATGNVLAAAELAREVAGTDVRWAIRRHNPRKLWGGGDADELSSRGALGLRVREAVDTGAITLLTGVSIGAVERTETGLQVRDVEGNTVTEVDEIVVATGARPDLDIVRELRLDLDLPTEATRALGPLIDPNHHSCGSVPPHGAEELRHPEAGFFTVGMKSYGRAPTFLMLTGYEQVRSVAAELAGDIEAARRVELTLPSTGVCSTDLAHDAPPRSSCC